MKSKLGVKIKILFFKTKNDKRPHFNTSDNANQHYTELQAYEDYKKVQETMTNKIKLDNSSLMH